MQTRRSKFSPYRVEAAEPISHLATISSTLAAARVSSARLRPSPAETFGLSIICSPKWSVEGLCPPPNLPPILQPHQPPFPAVLTWTSNSILAILSIVLFSWNTKRDYSLCKKKIRSHSISIWRAGMHIAKARAPADIKDAWGRMFIE